MGNGTADAVSLGGDWGEWASAVSVSRTGVGSGEWGFELILRTKNSGLPPASYLSPLTSILLFK